MWIHLSDLLEPFVKLVFYLVVGIFQDSSVVRPPKLSDRFKDKTRVWIFWTLVVLFLLTFIVLIAVLGIWVFDL